MTSPLGTYAEHISELLRPRLTEKARVLDLFAGCGGLALGFEAAGFETVGYEKDLDCCNSYSHNLSGRCLQTVLTVDSTYPEADVVIGGPPCQPFSVGGNQLGLRDARDGFPAFISAVKQLAPKLFLFENVRGLLYRNKWYLSEVISSLEDIGYTVDVKLLNAIDFFVPQNRERLVVVGHKGGYAFPCTVDNCVTSGEALGQLAFEAPTDGRYLTPSMDEYVARYEKASKCINPRDLNLGKPARTLTCRNLSGATGDMQRVRMVDGRRRRLSIREAARLQSFPDWFHFYGSDGSQFNQIGNAVAPMFSLALAKSVSEYLALPYRPASPPTSGRREPVQAELAFS